MADDTRPDDDGTLDGDETAGDGDTLALDDGVARIHEHLRATERLPLSAGANRWLGEATAVVADLDGADLDEATVRERLDHVRRLLSEVDETGHPEGDDHVVAARALVERLLA